MLCVLRVGWLLAATSNANNGSTISAGGSLDERAAELDSEQQWTVALGVAYGVRHLHIEKVVHRDLAARNILLDEKGGVLVAKVADCECCLSPAPPRCAVCRSRVCVCAG